MNLIDHLHSTVTPKVLEIIADYAGDDKDKRNVLSSFFGIFGARLSDPEALNRVQNLSSEHIEDGNYVLDAVLQDENGDSQISGLNAELAKEFNLPEKTVGALTTAAAPLVFNEFKTLAGTNTISGYLQEKLHDLAAYLPDWAVKLLPLGLLGGAIGLVGSAVSGLGKGVVGVADKAGDVVSGAVSGVANVADKAGDAVTGAVSGAVSGVANVADKAGDAVSGAVTGAVSGVTGAVGSVANAFKGDDEKPATHVNSQVTHTEENNGGGFLKALLPIIGLVILAGLAWLMLRGCQEKPAPVAKPVEKPAETAPASTAPVNATPATFSLATDEKGETIYSCRGEAGSEGVFASIRTALSGVFGVADKCNLAVTSGVADSLPAGDHLEGIFKLMKGVPNSSVSVNDKTIRFNAGNPDDLAKLVEGAKALVPADFVVEAEPQLDAAAAVANSIDTAKNALSGLTDTATADDLVRALNLQIINFATASSDIPAENKEILDLAATKLAQLPDAKLKITGHTDSQGKYESNKTLSDKRAKAVHDYLVSKGVPDERLETFGASSDHPVATNATEQGRFQNRRIEFTLMQDGEQIAAVGNAPSSPATAEANAQANAEQPAETAEPKAEESKPAESK